MGRVILAAMAAGVALLLGPFSQAQSFSQPSAQQSVLPRGADRFELSGLPGYADWIPARVPRAAESLGGGLGGAILQQSFSWNSSYQAAAPGQTIIVPVGTYTDVTIFYKSANANRCSVSNPSGLITFDIPNAVTATGEFEIRGSCIRISGRSDPYGANATFDVKGRIMAITDVQGQHPDNVLVEHAHTNTIAVHGGASVTYRDIDVGPATTTSTGGNCFIKESPGAGDENKVAQRAGFTPTNILWERLHIHDQNADRNRELGDCHFGGLFIINADGFTLRNSIIGSGNVVYNVQIQNFAGPAPRNLFFLSNAIACPAEWAYIARECNGQWAIQLNTSDQNVGTITVQGNNWSSNALYGCAVPGCRQAAFVASGNTQFPLNYTPPPVPGETPPPPPPAQCADGLDNDNDGKVDLADPGCANSSDNDETDPIPPPPTDSLPLRILSQSQNTVTLGWTPTGNRGYIFYRNSQRVSNTFDPTRSSVTFQKVTGAVFKVEALNLGPFGSINSP